MSNAKREAVVVSFGEADFTVRPLTLAQVEKVQQALGADGLNLTKTPVSTGIEIVLIALKRDNPDITADDLEGTANDIARAIGKILPLAFEQADVGEAEAAAKSA